MKENEIITPEEYSYWKLREQRIFTIDYEIDEDYQLIELSKVILLMNVEEINIPENELKPIYIFVHSFGGDLRQTMFFCDLISTSRIPVITVAMGAAMSAGFQIFLAGKKRYAFKHSQLLVHAGYAGFEGTASEMEEFNKNYKKQIAEMKEYILEHTGIDERVFNKNKNKDWYLTADELVKYKVVDKLIDNITEIFE